MYMKTASASIAIFLSRSPKMSIGPYISHESHPHTPGVAFGVE